MMPVRILTVLAFALLLGMALVGARGRAQTVQSCVENGECHSDECAVADIRGGWKCIPRQYTVMVWDAMCIKAVHKSEALKLEAPLDDDGQPKMSEAKLAGVQVEFARDCGHIEVRSKQ
jgi:hypothetical protein